MGSPCTDLYTAGLDESKDSRIACWLRTPGPGPARTAAEIVCRLLHFGHSSGHGVNAWLFRLSERPSLCNKGTQRRAGVALFLNG